MAASLRATGGRIARHGPRRRAARTADRSVAEGLRSDGPGKTPTALHVPGHHRRAAAGARKGSWVNPARPSARAMRRDQRMRLSRGIVSPKPSLLRTQWLRRAVAGHSLRRDGRMADDQADAMTLEALRRGRRASARSRVSVAPAAFVTVLANRSPLRDDLEVDRRRVRAASGRAAPEDVFSRAHNALVYECQQSKLRGTRREYLQISIVNLTL